MEVDHSAPVRESGEIVIDAPPEVVWDTLTDLSSWPGWRPGVKSIRLDDPLAVGAKFEWKAGPGTIRSELIESDRPRSVGWRGRTLGITALHVWRMEGRDGSTRVFTEESWSGLLARALRRSMSKTVRKAVNEGLPALKREAEARDRSAS